MSIYKKTIFLSNKNNKIKATALLTLEKTENGTFGTIKSFGLENYNNLVLGLKINNEILKQNIILNNSSSYKFKLKSNLNFDGIITSIIVENKDNFINALVWGNNDNSPSNMLYEFKENFNNPTIKSSIRQTNIEENSNVTNNAKSTNIANLFESTDEEIEQVINQNLENQHIGNYKNEKSISQTNNKLSQDDIETLQKSSLESVKKTASNILETKNASNENNDNFFDMISEQLDDLFGKYPHFKELEELVPGSKWIKVDFENDGKYYIIGLIYENEVLKYIAYGVPGEKDKLPDELNGFSQWLQLNENEGYWIMYQDAETGESIQLNDVV